MSLRTHSTQADVLIVGAGPAGLAAAIAAARQGLQVEVIDTMKPPIDKACGEGLLPGSLESLAALGFDLRHDLDQIESAVIHGVRFISDASDSNHYATIQCAFLDNPGRGIRRTALHQLLLDRAISLGVCFHWENTVRSITTDNKVAVIHTNIQTLRARYLIGADGHRSRVASIAGLDAGVIHSRRIGLRQHYAIAPWSRFVEIYWSSHGQAYVTPISSTEICVAFIAREKHASPEQALHYFPALQRHLVTARPSGSPRGSITLGRTLHRVTIGNIALIGDASGSIDAITGEGLALGFRQAGALALAIKVGELSAYQQAHRRIHRLPTLISHSLLLMDRSPRLRNFALNIFERSPWLFRRLLQLHTGNAHLPAFEAHSRNHSTPPAKRLSTRQSTRPLHPHAHRCKLS